MNKKLMLKKYRGTTYSSVLGGVFSQQKDRYENDREDERKLFYVAMTRAKQYLFAYSSSNKKGDSPFVEELKEGAISK